MYFISFVFIFITVTKGIINVTHCYQYEENDDKLILNPNELVHLVLSEKIGKHIPHTRRHHTEQLVKSTITTVLCSTEETVSTDGDDRETLKLRKIWSRWGKWGACSVTCGNGVITRRRLCVSGRCAPGELEEQRRPCSRAPCIAVAESAEDLHDQD